MALDADSAGQEAMLRAARVAALMAGRDFVTPDDVRPMVAPVLRHRILLHPDAQLQGVTPDDRIAEVLRAAPVPRAAA